jgi:hypothetical protein
MDVLKWKAMEGAAALQPSYNALARAARCAT